MHPPASEPRPLGGTSDGGPPGPAAVGREPLTPGDAAAVRWDVVAVFVALAFGLSWLVALPLWRSGGLANPSASLVALVMMLTPAVSALVATFLVLRPAHRARYLGLVPVRPAGRIVGFILIGLLAPPLLTLAAVLLGSLVGTSTLDLSLAGFAATVAQSGSPLPDDVSPTALAVVVLATIPVNSVTGAVTGLGEELGWRGFLLPALHPLGTWPALLISGVVCGLWHAPLVLLGYNYGLTDVLGLLYMVVFCVLLGALVGWLRMRSASVWPCAFAHGAVNASQAIVVVLVSSSSGGISAPVVGWSGWLVLAAVVAVLAGTGQYRWAKPARRTGF